MYKNTTIWDHLWPRKLQIFKSKMITSAEAQNQGSPTRRWFYAPPKKQAPFFHEKHFQIFSFEKELGSISRSIASIWPCFSWGSPVPPEDPCLRRFRGVPGRGGCHWLGYLSLGEIWTSALRAGWDAFFCIFWGCHRNVDVKKNWINPIKDSCKAICAETYINKLFKIVCRIFHPAWSSCAACELLRRNKVWVCEWLSFLWFLALKDSEKGPTGNSKTPTRLPFVVCWPRISNMASRVKLRERLVVMLYSTARCFDSFRGYVDWFGSSKDDEAFEQECHATCSVCVVWSLDRNLSQNSNLVVISRIG